MPRYDFRCVACDTYFEKQLTIANRRAPETDPCSVCGETKVELSPSAPGIGDATRLRGRAGWPDGWKDTLKRIKSAHRGSTIDI